jgi:hypothetical protein
MNTLAKEVDELGVGRIDSIEFGFREVFMLLSHHVDSVSVSICRNVPINLIQFFMPLPVFKANHSEE